MADAFIFPLVKREFQVTAYNDQGLAYTQLIRADAVEYSERGSVAFFDWVNDPNMGVMRQVHHVVWDVLEMVEQGRLTADTLPTSGLITH